MGRFDRAVLFEGLFERLDVGKGLSDDGFVGGVDFLEEEIFDGHGCGSVVRVSLFYVFAHAFEKSDKAFAPDIFLGEVFADFDVERGYSFSPGFGCFL